MLFHILRADPKLTALTQRSNLAPIHLTHCTAASGPLHLVGLCLDYLQTSSFRAAPLLHASVQVIPASPPHLLSGPQESDGGLPDTSVSTPQRQVPSSVSLLYPSMRHSAGAPSVHTD